VVALELGIVGSIVLLAMWASHLALFRQRTLIAWFGLVVVVQNIVSCLFNSHLFDFTQGWLYVFGVGVIGGMVLRNRDAGERAGAPRAAPTAERSTTSAFPKFESHAASFRGGAEGREPGMTEPVGSKVHQPIGAASWNR
jgi:hypothetical protein